jgi:hypothetical protein
MVGRSRHTVTNPQASGVLSSGRLQPQCRRIAPCDCLSLDRFAPAVSTPDVPDQCDQTTASKLPAGSVARMSAPPAGAGCPPDRQQARGGNDKSHDQLMLRPQTRQSLRSVDPIRMRPVGTFHGAAKVPSQNFHNWPAARRKPNPNSDFQGRFGTAVFMHERRASPPLFVSPPGAWFVRANP